MNPPRERSADHEPSDANPRTSGSAAVPVGLDAPVMQVMASMRAMRRLKADPVPRELLLRLVEAATWAPSGSNEQAYSFVIVTDREQMRQLAPLWRQLFDWYRATQRPPGHMSDEHWRRQMSAVGYQAEHFEEIPALIIACSDLSDTRRRTLANSRALLRATARLEPRRALMALRNAPRKLALAQAASVYPGVQNLLLAARAHGLAQY